jgi:hypothetical protein
MCLADLVLISTGSAFPRRSSHRSLTPSSPSAPASTLIDVRKPLISPVSPSLRQRTHIARCCPMITAGFPQLAAGTLARHHLLLRGQRPMPCLPEPPACDSSPGRRPQLVACPRRSSEPASGRGRAKGGRQNTLAKLSWALVRRASSHARGKGSKASLFASCNPAP